MSFHWGILEVSDRPNSGVVDPDVDPSMAKLCGLRGQRLNLVAVGNVGGDRYGIRTTIGAFIQDVK